MTHAATLGPRQEELLSWLIGRAPFGHPVPVSAREIAQDLGYLNQRSVWHAIDVLTMKGFIQRLSYGNRRDAGTFLVLHRHGARR